MSKIAELQQSIKIHAQDVQEELASLSRWEDEMHRKNRAASVNTNRGVCQVPVRGTAPLEAAPLVKEQPKQSANVAEVSKEQGNEYFRKGDFADAIRLYTKGIESNPVGPTAHVLYANRAMCNLKLAKWDEVEKDCTKSLDLDRTYTKAYFRRAQARKNMGMYREARKDLEAVLAFNPHDAETISELKAVTLQLREKEKTADTKPKKKLVIEEVEDEEDEAPPEIPVQPQAHVPPPQSQSKVESQKSGKPLRLNSRVEELEDEPVPEPRAEEKAKAKHTDPIPQPKAERVVENKPKAVSPKKDKPARSVKIQAPKSFSEFERTYTDLNGNTQLIDQFFSLIDPSSMNKLFGVSLTSEVFCDWMQYATRQSADVAFHTLQGLASVKRIEELTMLLSDDEASLVKQAVQHASASGNNMSNIIATLQ